MANKKRKNEIRQAYQRKAQEQKFEAAVKKIFIYPCIALAINVLVLVLLFVTFADIYNSSSSVGVEVSVSGWSFVMSALTGNYTSVEPIYGDIAMPFYYYAAEWCQTIGTCALLAAIAVILTLVVQLVTVIRKNHVLNLISLALSVVSFVLLIVCFAKGIDMINSDIIPIYCGGNPLCTIRSYAIIPALLALGGGVVSAIATVKYFQASSLVKQ